MRTLTHKRTADKEAKAVIFKGKAFRHLIVFNKGIGHYRVISKLKRHFIVNDNTIQAGWLINGRLEFYSRNMVNERIEIANKGIK